MLRLSHATSCAAQVRARGCITDVLALLLLGAACGCSGESPRDESTDEGASTRDDEPGDEGPAADDGDAGSGTGSVPRDAGSSASARDASRGVSADADASADAGVSGDAASSPPPASSQPEQCDGKPLPPRARGAAPPFAVGPETAGLPVYWPTDGWRSEDPEVLGFDAEKLAAAVNYETPFSSSQAVFVVRHGYVAAEEYRGGFSAGTTHESYSMAKSYSSGLVGIAIAEGKLASSEERVCAYYPMQWRCDDDSDPRSRITVAHAMNLTTGLRWNEDWRSSAAWETNDAYGLNLLDVALGREAVEEPGQRKRYSTGDPALLSGVLQGATGMTVYAYAKQKIFDVIGTPGVRWNADTSGRTTSYAGLQATAADYAKYGYLYLHRGQWDGRQVVPSEWVDQTTRAASPCEDWNQWLWHVNPPVRLGTQDAACEELFCVPTELANLPPDAFFAMGVDGQFLFVVPSADLVAVRLAADMPGSERWDSFARAFLGALLDAIR